MKILLGLLLAVLIGVGLVYILPSPCTQVNNQGDCVERDIGAYFTNRIRSQSATNTLVFLEPTNSTTTDNYITSTSLTYGSEDTTNARMHLIFTGSSTTSVLNWSYYFGERDSSGNMTWYGEEDTTVTSNIVRTHGSSTLVHTLTPQTTASVYKNVVLPDMVSEVFKVTFDVDTATGSLYAEIVDDKISR